MIRFMGFYLGNAIEMREGRAEGKLFGDMMHQW